MSSILRLTIENFQSHQKTVLEPASNGLLTVVVGPSDSGKTAIIRALRWLLYNVPQGDDFIRVGCSLCRVTLELQNGYRIIRERTKATNRYKIFSPGAAQPEVFEGFGNVVPLEVRELTGVQPVTIGDMDLNLNMSEQLDGPFLGKSVSSGARARILGKLAGTEEVDHAAKVLGTDLYRMKQDEKRLSGEIAELEKRIDGYAYLPGMAKRIRAIEDHCGIVKRAQEKHKRFSEIRTLLSAIDGSILWAQTVVEMWQNVGLAQEAAKTAQEDSEKLAKLIALKKSLTAADHEIGKAVAVIDRVGALPIAEMVVGTAAGNIDRLRLCRVSKHKYGALEDTIEALRDIIDGFWGISEAELLLNRSSQTVSKLETLRRTAAGYKCAESNLDGWKWIIQKYSQIGNAAKEVEKANNMQAQHSNILSLQCKLKEAKGSLDHWRWRVTDWETRVAELEGAYKDALLSEGRCPTCGSDINSEKLKEVV